MDSHDGSTRGAILSPFDCTARNLAFPEGGVFDQNFGCLCGSQLRVNWLELWILLIPVFDRDWLKRCEDFILKGRLSLLRRLGLDHLFRHLLEVASVGCGWLLRFEGRDALDMFTRAHQDLLLLGSSRTAELRSRRATTNSFVWHGSQLLLFYRARLVWY